MAQEDRPKAQSPTTANLILLFIIIPLSYNCSYLQLSTKFKKTLAVYVV
ncbi:hypothetical protein LDG_7698 [Legionella drancourtii LLAP12]|uniref:Uncharacterized protein n=1 Tax=Legionella drancourtii LLAP12 TaxID=658187 RepID=G9EQZ4_9GAMM|nr:hypothetical protein LDG_7698 [Legionella drancourtii LLAP12]